jgi:hypothetical protein
MLALHARHVLDDPSAYTTSISLWSLENPLSTSVDSGTPKGLVHHGWCLHVGLLNSPECDPNHPQFQLAVGSLSPLLTTSGVSSEDIVPTGGRYGCVTTGPYFGFLQGSWSDLPLR